MTTGGVVAGDRTAAVAPVVVVAGAAVVVAAPDVVVAGTEVVVPAVVLVEEVVDGDEEGVEPHALSVSIAGTIENPASNPRLKGHPFPGDPRAYCSWHHEEMSDGWTTMAVADVQPGDRVRMPNGQEVLVSRIEANFFGTDTMVAFIEDTPERWFKQPARTGDDVEVRRPGA